MSNKLQKILKLKKQYKENVKEHGKELVKELVAGLFVKDPNLQKIRWTQYTPYFNDGEACVFSAGSPEFAFSKESEFYLSEEEQEDKDEDDRGFVETWDFYKNKELKEKLKDLTKDFVESFNDMNDIFEEVFGDHVKVTVTRESVEVTEFQHD